MDWAQLVKLVHLVTVVLMAAPFYALIVVNERALFSSTMLLQVDRYMENLIRKQAMRCYVFQLTILASGIALALLRGWGLSSLVTNWVLGVKLGLLLLLLALLSVVHFNLQPRIDRLLAQASDDPVPKEIASGIRPLRIRRKRLGAICLLLVLTIIVFSLQIYARFNPWVTLGLLALAGLFSWRTYRAPVPYGWA